MLNIENIGHKFKEIVNSDEWKELQEKYNYCDDIYVMGHGGNMAVADHTAIDMTRLSNGTKNAMCPGSSIVATSLINDTNFQQWLASWLKQTTSTRTKSQIDKSLVYGISSSGKSEDVLNALQWASDNGMKTCLITAKDISIEIKGLTKIILGLDYYHTSECLSLLLQYQLTHGSGNICPPIEEIRETGFPDELTNICVDFDGVIHKNSKGYYDGTVYDEPLEDARESLERLSRQYDVIIFTAKAKSDRGLVNGKTGTELVWEWLKKYDMAQFVKEVTAEKPRAVEYIDDKAVKFVSWEEYWNES